MSCLLLPSRLLPWCDTWMCCYTVHMWTLRCEKWLNSLLFHPPLEALGKFKSHVVLLVVDTRIVSSVAKSIKLSAPQTHHCVHLISASLSWWPVTFWFWEFHSTFHSVQTVWWITGLDLHWLKPSINPQSVCFNHELCALYLRTILPSAFIYWLV